MVEDKSQVKPGLNMDRVKEILSQDYIEKDESKVDIYFDEFAGKYKEHLVNQRSKVTAKKDVQD